MTKAQIRNFERTLEAKAAELGDILSNRRPIAIEYCAEQTEQMVMAANREIGVVALDRNFRTLRQIHAALGRIREGSYGACERCGEPVGHRRLEAVPWAPYCIGCQEKMENLHAAGEAEDPVLWTSAFLAAA